MAGAESRLSRVIRFIAKTLPSTIIGSLIFIGIAINFANVIGRRVFSAPIFWAEEVLIFIMAWIVFLGAVAVSWDGRHLRMDLLSRLLPSPWKQIINLLASLALLAICLLVIRYSFDYVKLMYLNDQRSNAGNIPMAIPHLAVLTGFTLIFVGVLYRIRSHMSGDLESEVDELLEEYGTPEDEGADRPETRAGD